MLLQLLLIYDDDPARDVTSLKEFVLKLNVSGDERGTRPSNFRSAQR